MQMFEVKYVPENGTGSTISEHLVLSCDRPTYAVRAMHPGHKVLSLTPVSGPLKDVGQYTYWMLDFSYSGKSASMLSDEETLGIASKYLSYAEHSVDYVLAKLRLEAKPSYAWPDGSLYYVVRTTTSIADIAQDINRELEALNANPFSIASHIENVDARVEFGKSRVFVRGYDQIANPFLANPHKAGAVNYVEYFETLPYWDRS